MKAENVKLESLTLHHYPSEVLRKVAEPVDDPTAWKDIVRRMFEIMHRHNGCGLAAPQVGISAQLFILNTTGKELVFFNPEITNFGERSNRAMEGCLSLPGINVEVERPTQINFKAIDLSGKIIKGQYCGWTARAFMHENEHLLGRLLFDYISSDHVSSAIEKVISQLI